MSFVGIISGYVLLFWLAHHTERGFRRRAILKELRKLGLERYRPL